MFDFEELPKHREAFPYIMLCALQRLQVGGSVPIWGHPVRRQAQSCSIVVEGSWLEDGGSIWPICSSDPSLS